MSDGPTPDELLDALQTEEETIEQVREDRNHWRSVALRAGQRARLVTSAAVLVALISAALSGVTWITRTEVADVKDIGQFQVAHSERGDCRAEIQSAAVVADQLSDAAFKVAFDPALSSEAQAAAISMARVANDQAIAAANRLAAVDNEELVGSGQPGTPDEQECPAPEPPEVLR